MHISCFNNPWHTHNVRPTTIYGVSESSSTSYAPARRFFRRTSATTIWRVFLASQRFASVLVLAFLASNPMSDTSMPSSVLLTSSPPTYNYVAQAEYDRDILRLCTWRCIPDDMLDGVFRKAGTVRFVSYMRQKPWRSKTCRSASPEFKSLEVVLRLRKSTC